MIISKTDFIYDLYNQPGIYIQEYDKKYSCNAKNNKNRDVVHLLITNYDTNEAVSSTPDSMVVGLTWPPDNRTEISSANIG